MERLSKLVNLLSGDFQRRYEPNFAWKSVCSQFMGLPGLRGFWPMSAFSSAGAAYDQSGNGRTLTLNGNTYYGYLGTSLIWYVVFDGTGDYLNRADEAGLDIIGNETYIQSNKRGLTLGGWFNRDVQKAQGYIGKHVAASRAYGIDNTGVNNDIRFSIWDAGGTRRSVTGTGTSGWDFIVGVFKPDEDRVGIFINGTWTTAAIPAATTIRNTACDFGVGRDTTGDFDGQATLCFLSASSLAFDLDSTPTSPIIFSLFNQSRAMFRV